MDASHNSLYTQVMERGLLSDAAVQGILHQAMERQFSRARPATRHFFEHVAPEDDQDRTITIHSWVIAKLTPADTREIVEGLANTVVKEVVKTAAAITGELVFTAPHLLPQPKWTDGRPLFADERFGVQDGNVVKSSGCFATDVKAAAERLSQLDEEYPGDERLQLFCAKPLERKLMRAAAKAAVPCRVFGIYNFKEHRAWVLTRDSSACSLLIGRPSFELPVEENNLVVGARFVVWINDPRLAVCVTPEENA